MRFMVLVAILLGLAAPVHAQGNEAWSRSESRLTLNQARISFPLRVGRLSLTQSKEFSRPGESLDSVAQYESADRKVFATVYVYYPGIAHAGIQSISTDNAIRLGSSSPVTSRGSQVVAAGGRNGVAIRTDYSGYRGNLASSAAFIKAGRWMVKFRVSGPEGRKAEVEEAMSALLADVRFEGDSKPRPAALLDAPACAADNRADAKLVREKAEKAAALALIVGSLDAAGESANGRDGGRITLPSRIGSRWCLQTLSVADQGVPMLRATDPATGERALEGKSMLFVLYADSGGLLEVVRLSERENRYVLLNHAIGSTSILATFDAVPSDRQIAQIMLGPTEAGRPRARVNLKADGNTDIQVEAPPVAPASPTT